MKKGVSRKLAVILHADVAGSTELVRHDEALAHERIQDAFSRLSTANAAYGGITHEIRGDALVAEFERASDAVCAALAFQASNAQFITNLFDAVLPELRIGIALGEVIIDDHTMTGEGVVLAQRLEQLAESGEVVVQGSVAETVPSRLPFEFENLGERALKGFDEPIRAFGVRLALGEELPSPESADSDISVKETACEERIPLELPDKPSIAVLPFTNMSADPEQEFLADGISEDIITALSKFRWFFVTARNSTFTYKGQAIDIKRVGEEMGVRYVLEGSLRRAADRIRVSAQLIEAASGNHIWAERYDRQIEDIFELQDEITMTIAAAVEPELAAQERDRAVRKPTQDLKAWDLFQRGIAKLWQMERKDIEEGEAYLRQALEVDPNFGRPHGYLAYCYFVDALLGWSENEQEILRQGIAEAKAALAVDQRDSFAHFALGRLYNIGGDHQAAAQEIGDALRINPNFAHGYVGLASVHYWLGDGPAVLENADIAIRLSPNDPLMWLFLLYRAHGYELIGDFERAIECFEQAARLPRAFYWPFSKLAAAYYEVGRKEEAAAAFEQARLIEPNLTLESQRKALHHIRHNKFDYFLRNLEALGLK